MATAFCIYDAGNQNLNFYKKDTVPTANQEVLE